MTAFANPPSQDGVFQEVLGVLTDMMSDWDVDFEGGIGMDTTLIDDLSFQSIDVVHLVTALEEHFQRRDLPFQDILMEDGKYLEDIRIGEIVEFLVRELRPK